MKSIQVKEIKDIINHEIFMNILLTELQSSFYLSKLAL